MSRSTGTDLSFAAAEELERLRITDTDHLTVTYCESPQEAQDTPKAATIFHWGLDPLTSRARLTSRSMLQPGSTGRHKNQNQKNCFNNKAV